MTAPEADISGSGSKLRAYLELVRVPNVFTAMADVAMGFLFTHLTYTPGDGWRLAVLIAASTVFYSGGVVLNDVFDCQVDCRQRSRRPIPSGRVSLGVARWLGWELILIGLALAWTAAYLSRTPWPGIVGVVLVGWIVLYNAGLKSTFLGPLAMGACRFSNVLLGMSAVLAPWRPEHWIVAAAIGTYVVGVTWFARTEAVRSSRLQLSLATAVILAGIGILSLVPGYAREVVPLVTDQPGRWTLLMLVLGAVVGFRCLRAVMEPAPARVQAAVRTCILSLVILDAAACFVVQGLFGAVLILVLLVPASILGHWIDST